MPLFFINRPVFAWVLAIITMFVGVFALVQMPLEQYPNIAPPSVSISTSLPGASAEILENSVTQIIEQALVGIDNIRYFSSSSDSDGNVSIRITFEQGTNPDIAQVQVQNKLQNAMPFLPQIIQRQGVVTNKANNNMLMSIAIYSTDPSVSDEDINDMLLTSVKDQIARINGVGAARPFGAPHGMRIWLDPNKLAMHKLNTNDVVIAVEQQNRDIVSGQIGSLPAVKGQGINAIIIARKRLKSIEEFENIVVKSSQMANNLGGLVRLKDVARIEIGSMNYSEKAYFNGLPASGMAVVLASGANAVKTSQLVKQKMDEISKTLPSYIKIAYPYDSIPFVKKSIKNVVKTLIEAILLVFVVMYLFMQNFRATIIPTIAVPVVLLGTCATLFLLGFTLNTFTMFAMIIAIGLLVDDAIVVVENVERLVHSENLSVAEATKKSMKQITPALVGIAVVLSAVFVPMGFFGGSAGQIYKQFSATIVIAMIFSVFVAMILTPTLCIQLLQNNPTKPSFGIKFDAFIERLCEKYLKNSYNFIKRPLQVVVIYIVTLGVMGFVFGSLPKAFLPDEDQGFMYYTITTPQGSTNERTLESVKQVEKYLLESEKDTIERVFSVNGYSRGGSAQNVAFGFIGLHDWKNRTKPHQSVFELSPRASKNLKHLNDALAFTFFPPAIRELGSSSGLEFELLDKGGFGYEKFKQIKQQLFEELKGHQLIESHKSNGLEDVAFFEITINDAKAFAMGVSPGDINDTIQQAIGSMYINDFIENGRVKRVFIHADAPFRMLEDDILHWYVRSRSGQMVALSNVVNTQWKFGPAKLERFNGFASFNIQVIQKKGVSTGDAMKAVEDIIYNKLPRGTDIAWVGISYEESKTQSKTLILYAVSMLVVFLCLAALYESWSVPFAVILSVPFGIIGASLFCYIFKTSNDIFFQVAILTTMGLGAKNAILIIEFAKTAHEGGENIIIAALQGLKLRFRPILMTSLAFMLGILPLVFSRGAGAASQKAIGLALTGGMITATFVAILFVPAFYVFVVRVFSR